MTDTSFQTVGQGRLNRGLHVWKDLGDGRWKCVLCGGISVNPEDPGCCARYEPLTDEERAMCPLQRGGQNKKCKGR